MAFLLRKLVPIVRVNIPRVVATANYADTGTKEHIDGLVKGKKVVVFMKGNPDSPRCGFSNAVAQILHFHGVDNYESHNILEDEDLRQGNLTVFHVRYYS